MKNKYLKSVSRKKIANFFPIQIKPLIYKIWDHINIDSVQNEKNIIKAKVGFVGGGGGPLHKKKSKQKKKQNQCLIL